LLGAILPFSVLSGIRIFDPGRRDLTDFGFEMDALLHLRYEGADWIIIIEAKRQPVQVTGSTWTVYYEGKPKDVTAQVSSHVRSLWSYLEPIAVNRELRFLAVVVSSEPTTLERKVAGFRNAEVLLTSIGKLPRLLSDRFNLNGDPERSRPEAILRVAQSEYLDLLRLSLARPELGHPEYTSALRYVERCRRALDDTLFLEFKPTPERWAINGSAGMGKSVLLAYAAVVFSTGYELKMFQNEPTLVQASTLLKEIGFDASKGSISIAAMSSKQLETLRFWFRHFVGEFQKSDEEGRVRVKAPNFILCRTSGDLTPPKGREWSALFVDEAHDLAGWATRELAEQYAEHGFYLAVACDRHQKLRLTNPNARIVEGIEFQRKSTRLKQVYRNPAAVYIASLALMFRWFAPDGPKVVPTLNELDGQFGFSAVTMGKDRSLSIRNDAHPANSWSHTIASFPDVSAAFIALRREKLAADEVLWVRFSEEDPDFDYEKLAQHFTYHNCRSEEAHKISDKYIKGQDYPVVVIEGFPGFMDRFESREQEGKMWEFRRELYLCTSRATCFLYFVCNVPETHEVKRIKTEISTMMQAVSSPDSANGGTRNWKFVVKSTDQVRSLDVFIETTDTEVIEKQDLGAKSKSESLTTVPPPITSSDGHQDGSTVASVPELSQAPESYTLDVDGSLTVPEFAEAMEVSLAEVQSLMLDLKMVVTSETVLTVPLMKRLGAHWNTTVMLAPVPPQGSPSPIAEDETPAEPTHSGIAEGRKVQALSPSTEGVALPRKHPDPVDESTKSGRNTVLLKQPIIAKDLARSMGLKPFQVVQDLMEMSIFASWVEAIDLKVATRICNKHGFVLRVEEEDEPVHPGVSS
jgi:hypothetical protein